MASIINASTAGAGGVITTADASGVLQLQTAGATAVTVDASQNVTLAKVLPEASGGTGTTTGYYGFKNRIINGAMQIDQRNAGTSVTPTSTQYTLDRWAFSLAQTSKLTCQQNAGSVTPPIGFTNYLGVTSSSSYAVLTGDFFGVYQPIEGFNCADLAWGTANAQTVTLSFWVRSSLTGAFGGAIRNSAGNRSYPFTYTISSANTWEQKTVTIAGDTTGTWATNNTAGMSITFGLGAGSTFSGTAGAWTAGNFISATGATSVVGTNGATFYITGVQLEKGTQATAFEWRSYGTELALCQRYYQMYNGLSGVAYAIGQAYTTTNALYSFIPVVQMRAVPTLTSLNIGAWNAAGTSLAPTSFSIAGSSTSSVFRLDVSVSSGLVAGNASGLNNSLGNGFIAFSAEL